MSARSLPWYRRIVNGLERWPKEHFSVFVGSKASGSVAEVPAPALRYFADPFVWTQDGCGALFVEEFDYLGHRGRLRCLVLDEALRAGAARTIIDVEPHVSFPFIFGHAGALYMVPETCHDGCVALYRCEAFPHRWTRMHTLLQGVDAADSVLFEHGARWWLLTSIREHGDARRYLALYSAPTPLASAWQPHPVNARRLYSEEPHGGGRNAGAPLRWQGALLRPAQRSAQYYGQGLRWMRIEELTENHFHEAPFEGSHPLVQLTASVSPHHVSSHGDLVAWDVRDRLPYWQRVPRDTPAALPCSG